MRRVLAAAGILGLAHDRRRLHLPGAAVAAATSRRSGSRCSTSARTSRSSRSRPARAARRQDRPCTRLRRSAMSRCWRAYVTAALPIADVAATTVLCLVLLGAFYAATDGVLAALAAQLTTARDARDRHRRRADRRRHRPLPRRGGFGCPLVRPRARAVHAHRVAIAPRPSRSRSSRCCCGRSWPSRGSDDRVNTRMRWLLVIADLGRRPRQREHTGRCSRSLAVPGARRTPQRRGDSIAGRVGDRRSHRVPQHGQRPRDTGMWRVCRCRMHPADAGDPRRRLRPRRRHRDGVRVPAHPNAASHRLHRRRCTRTTRSPSRNGRCPASPAAPASLTTARWSPRRPS